MRAQDHAPAAPVAPDNGVPPRPAAPAVLKAARAPAPPVKRPSFLTALLRALALGHS